MWKFLAFFLAIPGIYAGSIEFDDIAGAGSAVTNAVSSKFQKVKGKLMNSGSEEYGRRTTSGDLVARPGFKLIRMPDMHAQEEYNTCGTHNMARYLKHIGYTVNWDAFLERATDRSFFKPFATTDVTGTMPRAARSFLRQYNPYFQLKEGGTIIDIVKNLVNNRPVMVLIRCGFMAGGAAPSMHWIMLVGYDTKKRLLYFYDTGGNGIKQTSWDQFRTNHNFDNNYGALDFALNHLAQVKAGSMIYCGPANADLNNTCNARGLK
ncbi:MAG: C39 family peptidase [Candidatus Cloacimonetes bacterium]|nr:C39 family peptidase [Candidatus Cloacimonadota bacterium]